MFWRYLKNLFKIIIFFIIGKIALLLIIPLLLYVPIIQNFIATKTTKWLSEKTHTTIQLEKINIKFPLTIVLKNIKVINKKKNIVNAKEVSCLINPLSLLYNTLSVSYLNINNTKINLKRDKNNIWNYDPIKSAFTSKKSNNNKTSKKFSFNISVSNITLKDISFNYEDYIEGTKIYTKLKLLKTDIASEKGRHFRFHINKPVIHGLYFKYLQTIGNNNTSSSTNISDYLSFNDLLLTNSKIVYKDTTPGSFNLYFEAKKSFYVNTDTLDIGNNIFSLNELKTSNFILKVVLNKISSSKRDNYDAEPKASKNLLHINVKQADIKKTNIAYINKQTPKKNGFNYNDMNLQNLNLKVSNFYLKVKKDSDIPTIKANFKQLQFNELNSNLIVKKFRANFLFNNEELMLKKFLLKTPSTILKNEIIILWPNLSKISNNLNKLAINLSLTNSKIYVDDILKYDPNLKNNNFLKTLKNETIFVDAKIKGKIKSININALKISIDKKNYASVNGQILNLTNTNELLANIKINEIRINSDKLITLLSKNWDIKKYIPLIKETKFVSIYGRVRGNAKNLNIDLKTSNALLNAQTNGYININKKYIDIFSSLKTNKSKLIIKEFTPSNFEKQYRIPNNISIKTNLRGTLNNVFTNTEVISNQGSVGLNGILKKRSQTYYYNTTIKLNKINIGYFINNEALIGKTTGTLNIKGHSFDYSQIQLAFKADISNLELNNYNYNNIYIDGRLDKKFITLRANIDDTNLQMAVDTASINNRNHNLSLQTNAKIYYANLQKLQIAKDNITISSNIDANFSTLQKENINGQLLITDFAFAREEGSDIIDSIKIDAYSQKLAKKFSIKSDFINASAIGDFKISELTNSVKYILSSHLNNIIDYKVPTPSKQNLSLEVKLHKSPSLNLLIPQLGEFQDSDINVEMNTLDRYLKVNINLPKIEYKDVKIENMYVNASIDKNNAKYYGTVNQINYNNNSLNNLYLNGNLTNSILTNTIEIADATKKQKEYKIDFDAHFQPNYTSIYVKPDIILDNYKWHIKENNIIKLYSNRIAIENYELKNHNSTIKISDTNDLLNDKLQIQFDNFNIKTISKIIQQDDSTELVNGVINGDLWIKNIKYNPVFNSDIKIKDLTVQGNLLGDFNLQAKEKNKNIIIKSYLNGNSNNIKINGSYNSIDKNSDFDIKINQINLKTIESLTQNQLQNLKGDLYADINIKGKLKNPQLSGELIIKNLSFKVLYLNTSFLIRDETIKLAKDINLNNFTILDSDNNKAIVNGHAKLDTDINNIITKLDIDTKHFKLVGDKNIKNQKELFYGPIYITSNTSINKISQDLNVVSKLWVVDNTIINILMPNKTSQTDSRESIVRFTNKNLEKEQEILKREVSKNSQNFKKSSKNKLKLNLDATINITNISTLKIILDRNGDELLAKGNATLNMSIQNGSQPILTGRYIISQGYYKLSMQGLLTKKFNLEKDSFIAWEGKVQDADLNVNATYSVDAAPLPLVDGVIQNISDEDRNKFREKLPFEIKIHMLDKLMSPNINFELALSNDSKSRDIENTIQVRLKQINLRESELNKQVIGLLAFKRFIEDDPFESLNNIDTDLDIKARNTVGNLLASQLNQLSNNAIKGIGINFGFNSKKTYDTGFSETQTNLDINLKKQLFNDRLTITVGKSLALEGKDTQTKNTSNLIENISIEYALTYNRHYLLLFYSTTTDYNPLQTNIRETGLNFVMYKNYNTLKQLFKKHKRKNKQKTDKATNDNKETKNKK